MLGYTVSASNCLMRTINSCEAKINKASKLLNTSTRDDSVVEVFDVTSYNCGTSQVPIRKMEHQSRVKIYIFVVVRYW